MSTLSTKSIRKSLTTMRAAFAAGDFAKVRNAARYALTMLGHADVLPRADAPAASWVLVIRVVDLACQRREAEAADRRALFARNAA
jgi:hypothetical protein